MKKKLISCNLRPEIYESVKLSQLRYAYLIELGLKSVQHTLQITERMNELEQQNKKLYTALQTVQKKLHEFTDL